MIFQLQAQKWPQILSPIKNCGDQIRDDDMGEATNNDYITSNDNQGDGLRDNDDMDLGGTGGTNNDHIGENRQEHAIVMCIFEAIELCLKTGNSMNTFDDLLVYARHMYCRGKGLDYDDPHIKQIWPKNWKQSKEFLSLVGYEDAKEFIICLNNTHPKHWDIMESDKQRCRYGGEIGTIKYYYLGLKNKVKQFTSNADMCRKMTAHWSEKEHWMHERENGWIIKSELWDGKRFSELAWFWDPNKSWCLPARCKRNGCNHVIGATDILQAPIQPNGNRELYCPNCCTRFSHQPNYTKGDPRNIAYIGKNLSGPIRNIIRPTH